MTGSFHHLTEERMWPPFRFRNTAAWKAGLPELQLLAKHALVFWGRCSIFLSNLLRSVTFDKLPEREGRLSIWKYLPLSLTFSFCFSESCREKRKCWVPVRENSEISANVLGDAVRMEHDTWGKVNREKLFGAMVNGLWIRGAGGYGRRSSVMECINEVSY